MSKPADKPNDSYNRKENLRRFFRMVAHFDPFLFIGLVAVSVTLLFGAFSCRRSASHEEVIIYAAQDQVYAEPILREFEKETGIKVKAVYDSEAVKTTGLANRLLAERDYPRCRGHALSHTSRGSNGKNRSLLRQT